MKKWIVEFRYVVGLSAEISTIEVEGYSDVDAKRKAEKIISSKYKTFHILRAVEADKLQKEQSSGALNREKPRSVYSELDPETKRVVRAVKMHDEEINNQQKKINRIRSRPIKLTILVSVIFAVIFALSWIPFWYFNMSYNDAVDVGITGEDLEAIKNVANGCLVVPFVILGVGIIVSLVVFSLLSKKKKEQLPIALQELETIKVKPLDL